MMKKILLIAIACLIIRYRPPNQSTEYDISKAVSSVNYQTA